MGVPTEIGLWSDFLGDFSLGVNSDVPPIALPKNQLAFATNCTVRGAFLTHRPPFIDFTLSQAINGLFQGASYYKPDSGPESIVMQVGGYLYKVTPATSGVTADVTDIGITDDPNSATNPFAWMWQGENYLFVNNGEAQTQIFDGNSTRRSDIGTIVATTSANATVGAIDTPFLVTLTADYDGPIGVPLDVFPSSSATQKVGQFQASLVSTGGYNAVLTNLDDTAGATIPVGSDIVVVNSFNGNFTETKICPPGGTIQIGVSPTYTPGPGTTIRWGLSGNFTFLVTAVNGSNITMRDTSGVATQKSIVSGDPFNLVNPQPNTVIGTTQAAFVVPVIGEPVNVTLVTPYSGADNKYVTIDGQSYKISKGSGGAPTNQIYLSAISFNNIQPGYTLPAGAILKTLPELPIGTIGAYGLGRNWIALPDRKSYLASDIVGGSSGTIANSFRDAIINVTENNYLAGGGVFRVPGAGQQINTMAFPATLDSSLGQGPLQVLTQSVVFSCNAPVQRSEWQNLTNPIQTQSLVGAGSLGECAIVNGDIWFRAPNGVYSLKLARQDFIVSYANTPQSIEMNRVLIEDDRALLAYFRTTVFDNRLLFSANPELVANGVQHPKIVALNLDPNSGVSGKQPPVYDGVWTGLNVVKLVSGEFNGVERSFAVTLDDDGNIGLTELLPTAPGNYFDNASETDGRIQWSFESPALFFQPDTRKRQLLRLSDGEIFVKDLVGTVEFSVYFRPDYMSDWTLWHYWSVTDNPTFQPRMGLGTPPVTGDEATGRPNCVGYHFQIKVVIKGSCTLMGCNLFADTQGTTSIAPPITPVEGLTPLQS